MYWTTVTATIYNETNPKEYENLNEEGPVIEEEVFKHIDFKLLRIVSENSENRGIRVKFNHTLIVYLNNLSEYKGDIFDAVSFNLPGDLADYPECDELYDYLINTGKII